MSLNLVTDNSPEPQPKCYWTAYLRAKEMVRQAPDIMGLCKGDLMGRTRLRHIVQPRQILMLALHNRGLSYPQIGKLIERDHATVIHGVRRGKELIKIHPAYADLLKILEAVE